MWDDIAGIGYVVGEGDDFALDDIAEMNDAEVAQSGNPEGTEQSVRARNSAEEQAHAKRPALEQRAQTGVNRPTRLIGWLVVMGLIIVIVVVAIVLRARR